MLQQVFLSYRHESLGHARQVRRLGELLRQAKIPVELDQFHLDDHPGGPDLGWRQWCENSATNSACVLIIASEGWFAAYNKTAPPGIGLGAAIEADLFAQALYDDQGHNVRIRLAFLHDIPADKVPVRLRAWHQFKPFQDDDQLDRLIRWVGDRLGLEDVLPPTVSWPEPVPFHPDLADRAGTEWPAIVELLAGRSRKRILIYEGASGLGKSVLIGQAAAYAKGLKIPLVYLDFKGGGLDLAKIIGRFDSDLALSLPNFSRERQTHLLRAELRDQRQPVLVVFDTYEHAAGNETVADWLNQQFLTQVETALGLAVIIAGQKVPDYSGAGWRDLVRHLHLEPITNIEHWEPWVEQHYPDFQKKGAHLPTVVMFAQGNPAIVSGACEAIAKS